MRWTGVYILMNGEIGKDTKVWTESWVRRLVGGWSVIVDLPSLVVHEWTGPRPTESFHAQFWIFVRNS